jgi:hypothetical protein
MTGFVARNVMSGLMLGGGGGGGWFYLWFMEVLYVLKENNL